MQTNGFFFPGFPKYLLSLLPVAKTANDCVWLVFIGIASFLAMLVSLDTMSSLNVDLKVKLGLELITLSVVDVIQMSVTIVRKATEH